MADSKEMADSKDEGKPDGDIEQQPQPSMVVTGDRQVELIGVEVTGVELTGVDAKESDAGAKPDVVGKASFETLQSSTSATGANVDQKKKK